MSMPALPDLLFVALFAVLGPLISYSVYWPAYMRLRLLSVVFADHLSTYRSQLEKRTLFIEQRVIFRASGYWNGLATLVQ